MNELNPLDRHNVKMLSKFKNVLSYEPWGHAGRRYLLLTTLKGTTLGKKFTIPIMPQNLTWSFEIDDSFRLIGDLVPDTVFCLWKLYLREQNFARLYDLIFLNKKIMNDVYTYIYDKDETKTFSEKLSILKQTIQLLNSINISLITRRNSTHLYAQRKFKNQKKIRPIDMFYTDFQHHLPRTLFNFRTTNFQIQSFVFKGDNSQFLEDRAFVNVCGTNEEVIGPVIAFYGTTKNLYDLDFDSWKMFEILLQEMYGERCKIFFDTWDTILNPLFS